MTTSAACADDDVRLMQLINGFQASQAIYVAVTLGIPDLLHRARPSSDRLASLTGSHPAALYRLLRDRKGGGALRMRAGMLATPRGFARPAFLGASRPLISPGAIRAAETRTAARTRPTREKKTSAG